MLKKITKFQKRDALNKKKVYAIEAVGNNYLLVWNFELLLF